ncbi:MAG: hypothetical protein ACREIE_03760 [Nitrospiraceae bacterium]
MFPAPAGSPWTLVIKGVDESVTSTTVVQNDDELTFALIANTTYFFRAYIFFNTPIAADFKFSFVCTGTQTATESKVFSTMAGSVGSTSHGVNCSAGGDFIVTGTTLPMGYVTIEMVIKQSGTAGTWTFQWAQNTSNAGATKVRAGSYVEYTITP